MKDNGCDSEQFDQVNWSAFYSAIRSISRSHRISIVILTDQLWNTNLQNKKFYGTSDTFLLCGCRIESIHHLYCCSNMEATDHRHQAIKVFRNSWSKFTPPPLLNVVANLLLDPNSVSDYGLDELDVLHSQRSLALTSFHRGHVINYG
jgi:hypothetical protein